MGFEEERFESQVNRYLTLRSREVVLHYVTEYLTKPFQARTLANQEYSIEPIKAAMNRLHKAFHVPHRTADHPEHDGVHTISESRLKSLFQAERNMVVDQLDNLFKPYLKTASRSTKGNDVDFAFSHLDKESDFSLFNEFGLDIALTLSSNTLKTGSDHYRKDITRPGISKKEMTTLRVNMRTLLVDALKERLVNNPVYDLDPGFRIHLINFVTNLPN